ncbi:MAG: hypothetical protein RL662_370 [Bacteroidota bacterium]|jgi:lipopolysaccharide assembly outer membrane protein LptD (OstA)
MFVLFSSPFWGAQSSYPTTEHLFIPFLQDTIRTKRASLANVASNDTLSQDTIKTKKASLDAPVDYAANDSIVFDLSSNRGFLYGESNVDYQTMSVKAENIIMSMDSSIIHASYAKDSLGKEYGHPVFKDKDTEYEMKTVSYNFKSKKGYIRNVITQQGEGYIVADVAKKNADDSFFMCDGKYTTCDNHEHPHFYLMLTKAKVRPKKNVVTGPAYLVIEGLPLPLALPFGYFPFSEKYSSGILMPSYGDDMDRGFNLRGGGYYFAISDYIDLALTGEIYTKGSWGLNARSTYRKRYKYNGSFDINYMYTKYGDKEIPEEYRVAKDLSINWTHSQDPKANMYRTLSANVRYSTSTFNRYNQESLYNPNVGTSGTKSSSVTLSQRFPNSPLSLTANATANQRTQDSTLSLTLPNFTVTMSRIYPLKRKQAVGSEKWYEKIQMSYTGDFRNSIETKDNMLFKSSLVKDWKNGMQHKIPVSATFNLFNYINISPSFNYNERWYTNRIEKAWDPTLNRHVVTDTTYSFNRVHDFNYALSMQTKLYGFYEPMFKLGKVKTIRHVFTPSISLGGNPDFGNPRYGIYKSYTYIDGAGRVRKEYYSPFEGQIFGVPGRGQNSSINFGFENNLEMKMATNNDSTKIVSLIDNLGVNFSYNAMGTKGEKWSDISTNIRLKLSKSLMVNIASTWDPYAYKYDPINKLPVKDGLRIQKYGTLSRLKSTGYSISPSINQDTFKKWFGRNEGSKSEDKSTDEDDDLNSENLDQQEDTPRTSAFASKKESAGTYDSDGYLKNEVKWNLSMSYGMSYGYSRFDNISNEFKGELSHNLTFNGSIQPTKNWNLTFMSSYNFEEKKIPYLNCTVSRNLHCWNISASFIPFGPTTSYYVSLRVDSSMLQDLKYEQRSRPSSFDPNWY